ncbi:MAG TPA: S8 family serine peptidase, partial [Gemmatimonadales bacterium]|nr:S8 family serine peptidase [Gemmatimonadales bacterium]
APAPAPAPAPTVPEPAPTGEGPPRVAADGGAKPVLPPTVAYVAGLMPLSTTGVGEFLRAHPAYDGRGVLIAILDSGIDAGAPGLVVTSTGAPKVLDLRDFSGEGRVALVPVEPAGDGRVMVGGRLLRGAGRIARLATSGRWYAGTFRELPLGRPPAADLNGNGTNTDEYPVIVVRATDGWAAFLDSNLDGSFEDEMPLHDYRQGRETLALGTEPITLAANLEESDRGPVLDLYFDTSGHGTHVAGIAAGFNLYDVQGFHGVAPGAQLIGLKIANNARGGVTVHGSMVRAMEYAARFAQRRGLPLVLNLSFGVGNEREGRAVIDSIVNAFIAAHPSVVFAISAGNDGPGLSTVGFPGSADLAITVGATYPGVFARPPEPGGTPPADRLGFWSARGGELLKPDVVVPGIAFSTVPRWNLGEEVKLGTSMAAPHVSGLAACLLSAMAQEGRRVSGADIAQALAASARRFTGATVLDQGAGVPQLTAAYEWLVAGHQGSRYLVRTASGASAAFRHSGALSEGDTLEVFRVSHAAGLRAAQYLLRPLVPWLSAPDLLPAAPGVTEIPVVRRPGRAPPGPGVQVGTILAFNPNDTLAGPLFRLVTAVIVAHDLDDRPFAEPRRVVPAGGVQRYFFQVDRPDATLEAAVTLADSTRERALLKLYEPGGRPFRGGAERTVGEDDGGTARFVVRSEDLVPGVYELDVVARPLEPVTVAVRVERSPVGLAVTAGDLEATNHGSATARGPLRASLLGAQATFAVDAQGAPAESLVVRVPAWAASAEVEVRLPPEQWDWFTDFGVTVFDSAGHQVGHEPLNYAVGRQSVDVESPGPGAPLVVELFPAFAWADRAPPWQALVSVRFLLREPRPLSEGPDVSVVPGGRVRVPLPSPGSLPLPHGFVPLVQASLGGAVRRVTVGAGR